MSEPASVRTAAAAIALAAGVLVSCDARPSSWKAFIYPDGANFGRHLSLDGFQSFEACKTAAIDTLSFLGARGGDYECGQRCAFDPDYGIDVCAETRK